MPWRILVDEGANQVTIVEPTGDVPGGMSFAMSTVAALRPDGQTEYVDTVFDLAGDLEPTGTQPLEDSVQVLKNLVDQGAVVRVQVQQDTGSGFSTVSWGDLLPANHMGSPKVTEFRTLADEGAGENHWPWSIRIFARAPGVGSGGSPQVTSNVNRSIRVEKYKKAIIRKIWSIDVQAKTLAEAVAYAVARKPSVPELIEVFERFADNSRVVAVWTWEAAANSVIDFQEDLPSVKRGDRQFVVRKLAGQRKPLAHIGRETETIMQFSGRIRAVGDGDTAPNIQPPPKHLLADGQTILELVPDQGEHLGEPIAVDKQNGIWEIFWAEKYLVLDSSFAPAVNHNSHNKPFAATVAKEPPDGNFFN